MKIPNIRECRSRVELSLARIVSEDSQPLGRVFNADAKSSKDS